MVTSLAPKWTPHGFFQRLSIFVKEPSDLIAALHIGAFIARAPKILRRNDLRTTLRGLRHPGRAVVKSPRFSHERIVRLRDLCLLIPFLADRNTCYVRALTLYRFLDARDDEVGVHFGIEHRERSTERLRGHAWVTLHGKLLEGPEPVQLGRIREINIPLHGALK